MNRGKGLTKTRLGGYTIVEAMIFLAISAVMFFLAIQFVGGQQNRAHFINTVRNFETKLTDIGNDISTGYYQGMGSGNLKCTPSATGPVFDTGSAELKGSNIDCIFIGSVLKLGEGADKSKFTQYTLAGLRLNASGGPVASLSEAKPQLYQTSAVVSPPPYLTSDIGYGIVIECVRVGDESQPCTSNDAAIGFVAKLSGTSPSGGNNIQANVLRYPSILLSNTAADSVTAMNDASNYSSANLNPAGGITVCLKGEATKQYALVRIGGEGNNLTVSTEIKSYPGSALCS